MFQIIPCLLLYASAVSALPQAAPLTTSSPSSTSGTCGGTYQNFKGTNFPPKSSWLPFDQLVKINGPTIQNGNTPTIYSSILADIQNVSSAANIPPQIVLCQIMQESGGFGSVVSDGGKSFGLMQVQTTSEPPVRCDPSGCSPANILGMIQQGVNGKTGSGPPQAPGIAFYLNQYSPGVALRSYNTGSVPDPNDLSVATHQSTSSYVSDIANRLLGISPADFPTPQQLAQCGYPIANS